MAARIGVVLDDINLTHYDKQTIARHHQLILDHYVFTIYNHETEVRLAGEVSTMVRPQLKPRLMLWRCVDWLLQ